MKKIIHSVYLMLGYVMCTVSRVLFEIKVRINPIKEKSILFVAHPDDDVLFFNRIMKTEKPYVVLVTTGTSIIRINEFRKAMKYYSRRYNYYPLKTDDTREEKLSSIIKKELERGSFEKCYSHSPAGEYGHSMHKKVGRAVEKNVECRLFTTVEADEIGSAENELSQKEKEEKINVFKTIYPSQDFVLDEYGVWVSHEKITEAVR